MSELKAYIAYEADDFPDETEFYLKYEADKVIAEKDAKIAELKQEIERLKQENEMSLIGVNLHSPTSDGRLV